MDKKVIYMESENMLMSQIIEIQLQPHLITPQQDKQQDDQKVYMDFGKLIPSFAHDGLKQVLIFIPEQQQYIAFEELGGSMYLLPSEHLKLRVIMLKFKSITTENIYQSNLSPEDLGNIKERDRLRTIKDILTYVKKWRTYALQKNMSLQQAADLTGISKKSLDDYYYQLRIAEYFDFNFAQHITEKISYLRQFVKIKMPNRLKKQKLSQSHKKIPSKLRILDQIQFQYQHEHEQKQSENVQVIQEINLQQDKNYRQYKESENVLFDEKQQSLNSISQFWSRLGANNNILYDQNDSFFDQFKNPRSRDIFNCEHLGLFQSSDKQSQ